MKEFFPENAVEYFVSYYDYYQPEAYVPSSDTYIAKDSAINDEIDKLRLFGDGLTGRTEGCHHCGVAFPAFTDWAARADYKDMVLSLPPGAWSKRPGRGHP